MSLVVLSGCQLAWVTSARSKAARESAAPLAPLTVPPATTVMAIGLPPMPHEPSLSAQNCVPRRYGICGAQMRRRHRSLTSAVPALAELAAFARPTHTHEVSGRAAR